ncbi:alkylation response protein AidB-like acyl-CoA dehydrogenase [Diaminobutyricimonas aerilata]|uniref:Alkylation response protein AidB-like acyl-CoA dehydrogenase n=1 Tax=Diaminobutyricimonas aerilata TaxID=1162967 RepID=A0A2M9CM14_9MICO|nr:acyl-CoA dehydrogenase family protein [Diaminobutyricimonas aerilata]PJJ72929.1 alkylation response protein AidB-like acyl-CoA dehydrogenase [Diaminobutyricimonas aerilata]
MTLTDSARRSTLDEARARFRPLFDVFRADAARRDRDRELPTDAVRALKEAGFGALRIPVHYGGAGLSLTEFTSLLVELAEADSNLPQIFRGHIAFVEEQLWAADEATRAEWFTRFVAGETVGNAWSETGAATVGSSETVLRRDGDAWRLTGRKYYTTGTLFSEWAEVTATTEDGAQVTVLVSTALPEVTVSDDWDGFGQRLTGTGTAVFDGARVEARHVTAFGDRFTYQTALFQLVLLSVLAGVAHAAARDAADELRARSRVYSHGLAEQARHDGQLLAVVGEVSSVAFTAGAVVERVARALERAVDLERERGSDEHRRAAAEAEIAAAQGQVVLSESVPRAATVLFNALGASATSGAKDLDRHWRNARTVASHNPVVYKSRIVGDWAVNGTVPPFIWEVGASRVQG